MTAESYSRSPGMQLLLIVAGSIFLAMTPFASYEFAADQDWIRLALIGLGGLTFSTLILISGIRFRVTLTEGFIEKSEIRTKRIGWINIDRITLGSSGTATIHSGKTILRITSDIQDSERLLISVSEKLRGRTDIDIVGESDFAELFRKVINEE